MWKLYKIQILASVKFYGNPATRIHLCIVYGCFHAAMAELSGRDRDHVVYKADSVYCLALHRKDVLTRGLKECVRKVEGKK